MLEDPSVIIYLVHDNSPLKPRNPCVGAKYDYMGDGKEINSIIVFVVALQV